MHCWCLCEESVHRFSLRAGRNIVLRNSDCSALRSSGYDGGLVFSSDPLRTDELLEVVVLLGFLFVVSLCRGYMCNKIISAFVDVHSK